MRGRETEQEGARVREERSTRQKKMRESKYEKTEREKREREGVRVRARACALTRKSERENI